MVDYPVIGYEASGILEEEEKIVVRGDERKKRSVTSTIDGTTEGKMVVLEISRGAPKG